MNQMVKIMLSLGLASIFWVGNEQSEAASLYSYQTPEGVRFESDTIAWNQDRLKELAHAFSKNLHGEELKKLQKVMVTKSTPYGMTGEWKGNIVLDSKGMPSDITPSTITLYHGEDITDIQDMSYTLSHEYGHLFSYYWLVKKEKKLPNDSQTGWAKIRKLEQFPIRWNHSGKPYDHFWQPEEIIANDYAFLFGAPEGRTKLIEPFNPSRKFVSFAYPDSYENIAIPPVESIANMRDYWLKLSGIKASTPKSLLQPKLTSLHVKKEEKTGNGKNPPYVLSFSSASQDVVIQKRLQYFVGWGKKSSSLMAEMGFKSEVQTGTNPIEIAPKMIQEGDFQRWGIPPISKGKSYFRIYAYDPETHQLTYSPMYWYDFSDFNRPVPIVNPFQTKEKNSIYVQNFIQVHIDGKEESFDAFPYINKGTTFVPMRGIFEKLGAEVVWDNETRTVTATKEGRTIQLTLDQPIAYINNEKVELAQPATLQNGRTMVPLRFISEALDKKVEWNGDTFQIEIQ